MFKEKIYFRHGSKFVIRKVVATTQRPKYWDRSVQLVSYYLICRGELLDTALSLSRAKSRIEPFARKLLLEGPGRCPAPRA